MISLMLLGLAIGFWLEDAGAAMWGLFVILIKFAAICAGACFILMIFTQGMHHG